MAFTERELAKIDDVVGGLCRRRSHPEFKSQVRLEYRIKGHDVTILEWRARWDGRPGHTESGVAKFKLNRRTGRWRLLWHRADMKWHAYEPRTSSRHLSGLVAEVDQDPWGCFFG